MASPGEIVNAAVALVFHAERGQAEPIDFQRFLLAVTGDPLISGRYTAEQMRDWATAILQAVQTAAATPPTNH